MGTLSLAVFELRGRAACLYHGTASPARASAIFNWRLAWHQSPAPAYGVSKQSVSPPVPFLMSQHSGPAAPPQWIQHRG